VLLAAAADPPPPHDAAGRNDILAKYQRTNPSITIYNFFFCYRVHHISNDGIVEIKHLVFLPPWQSLLFLSLFDLNLFVHLLILMIFEKI
jgi:hypothetical protein